jgi:S-DNA-T family DNA segregation ATPase FtsK/SpoIIIE
MEVVVRTLHGDADIEIVAAPAAATLSELLRMVTGQAPPPTARVNSRTVATSRLIADLDLVIGTLIDTRPHDEAVPDDSAGPKVGLVQLTGRGAGAVTRLSTGRYRIGSARRLHASEMEMAPVETPAFELHIDDHGDTRVSPGPEIGGALGVYAPTLGAEPFDRVLPWTDGHLNVGGRIFALESPVVEVERRGLPAPAHDGSIPFQRPPSPAGRSRRVVVDAVRDATSRSGQLWLTRRTDPGAFDIGFGVNTDGTSTASVDLQRHRGVALVGSDRFTAALARTLLVEVATMHGPVDLDIVIASTPERVAQWNWSKWLPHVRRNGPGSAPDLFADAGSMAAWATSMREPAIPAASPDPSPDGPATAPTADWTAPDPNHAPARLTVLVLDDISLWNQRNSPIRSLLVDPPPELRIMALCVGLHEAPGLCTSLIEEVPPSDRLAHLSSVTTESRFGRPALFGSLAVQHTRLADALHVVSDIRPALTEVSTAADVARHLAPLDDLDATRSLLPPTSVAPPSLAEIVEQSSSTTAGSGLQVAIGRAVPDGAAPAPSAPVTIDLTSPLSTILAVTDADQHDQTVAAIVLGAASQRQPDELAVLIIGDSRPAWHSELAHIAGWAGRDEAEDASRLIHRVAHVLTSQPGLHVVVVIEHAFDSANPMPAELVTGMTELADSLPNVHVVLTGDHPDEVTESIRSRSGAFAWIAPTGRGKLWIGDTSSAFVGIGHGSGSALGPSAFDAPELVIRPTTHGRAMTPLERRLSRSSVDEPERDGDDLITTAVARQVTRSAMPAPSGRLAAPSTAPRTSLLPPPLPAEIEAADLLQQNQGDGVPIGIVDRPERAENETYWWQPGSAGSILAAGSPRSGMTSLLDLIITGIAARISADDLHVYAIEALPQRRRALEALPHTGSVVTPDEPDAVIRLVRGLRTILRERVETRSNTDRPDIVVLIGDISRLRRSLPVDSADETIDELAEIAAAGAPVGMNVVAVATRVDELGAMSRLAGDRLVGAMSDPGDRARLGAPASGPADRYPRRCWSTTADRRVQLAMPAASIDAEVTRLAPEPAQQRHPQIITPRAGA